MSKHTLDEILDYLDHNGFTHETDEQVTANAKQQITQLIAEIIGYAPKEVHKGSEIVDQWYKEVTDLQRQRAKERGIEL